MLLPLSPSFSRDVIFTFINGSTFLHRQWTHIDHLFQVTIMTDRTDLECSFRLSWTSLSEINTCAKRRSLLPFTQWRINNSESREEVKKKDWNCSGTTATRCQSSNLYTLSEKSLGLKRLKNSELKNPRQNWN